MGYDAARARTPAGLARLVRRLAGRVGDLRGVVLDDQTAKLHIPLAERVTDRHGRPRGSPRTRPAGRLLIGGVTDFSYETAGRHRWFGFDGLVWEPEPGRLTLVATDGLHLVAGVDGLDVTLRTAALPIRS